MTEFHDTDATQLVASAIEALDHGHRLTGTWDHKAKTRFTTEDGRLWRITVERVIEEEE